MRVSIAPTRSRGAASGKAASQMQTGAAITQRIPTAFQYPIGSRTRENSLPGLRSMNAR